MCNRLYFKYLNRINYSEFELFEQSKLNFITPMYVVNKVHINKNILRF
jgi:hypothetical protein